MEGWFRWRVAWRWVELNGRLIGDYLDRLILSWAAGRPPDGSSTRPGRFTRAIDRHARVRGFGRVARRNVGIDVHVDSRGSHEGEVLSDAVLRFGAEHHHLLVDDGEAGELMCASTLIGTSNIFLKRGHGLLADIDVDPHLHQLVGHAVEANDVLLSLRLFLQKLDAL